MAKADRYYYENFVAAADCCCDAAKYLKECLANYDYSRIHEMLETMHSYEHKADEKKHEMSAALAKAFVTPLDREDLALISQHIDDVADCIEEVVQRLYIDSIKTVMPEAVEFADKIVDCCELMKEILGELENFKRPKKLHEMNIQLSHMEEECDQLYLKGSHEATKNEDIRMVLFWREIFDHLEMCADACEHVSDCVETVVMKNT